MTPAKTATPIQTNGSRRNAARSPGVGGWIFTRSASPCGARDKPSGPVDDAEVRKAPPAVVEVEAVADEELVGHREARVAEREVVDEASIRAVEECADREARGLAQLERLHEVVEGQARVDDVLDEKDVAARDDEVEILDQADLGSPAESAVVAGEDDEIERVRNGHGPRQVSEKDERTLEDRDEDGLATRVVGRDLCAELTYTRA